MSDAKAPRGRAEAKGEEAKGEDVSGAEAKGEEVSGAEASGAENWTAARDDIRGSGLRATPARIAALLEIRSAAAPMTHADLAERLASSGVDKTTAFRNLNDLTGAGLLRRSELGDHLWRFEATDPRQRDGEGHPHFLCVDCGSVTCLGDVQLTAGSRRRSEAVGKITEILLRGHCHDCRPAIV